MQYAGAGMRETVVHYVTTNHHDVVWDGILAVACDRWIDTDAVAITKNPELVTCKRCRRTKVFTEKRER